MSSVFNRKDRSAPTMLSPRMWRVWRRNMRYASFCFALIVNFPWVLILWIPQILINNLAVNAGRIVEINALAQDIIQNSPEHETVVRARMEEVKQRWEKKWDFLISDIVDDVHSFTKSHILSKTKLQLSKSLSHWTRLLLIIKRCRWTPISVIYVVVFFVMNRYPLFYTFVISSNRD